MRALVLACVLALASGVGAQPLVITDVAVPASPRAAEGDRVTIPLRVTVQNTGRNARFAYLTAEHARGAESERVASSERIAPDRTGVVTVPLAVDLRSGAAPTSLAVTVRAYANATRVTDTHTLTLSVDREEPPADPPPGDDPPADDPPASGGLIQIHLPPEAVLEASRRAASGSVYTPPIPSLLEAHPPSLGLLTAGVLQAGFPITSGSAFPVPGQAVPDAERFVVGMRLVVMAQNLSILPRHDEMTLRVEAVMGGTRVTSSRRFRPYIAGGAVAPLVVTVGTIPTWVPPRDCSAAGTPFPGNPLNGIGSVLGCYAEQERRAEGTPEWPFELRPGDTFSVTLTLDVGNDHSSADNALTLDGRIGGELEMVLAPPRIHAGD